MNFWTPKWSPWGDNLDDTDFPYYTRYDWIKVETYNTETNEFNFLWQDDFDSFDDSRWYKKDGWAFGSSTSTFYASQVYTEDGHLVIKMEHGDDGEEGGKSFAEPVI